MQHIVLVERYGIVLSYRWLAEAHWLTFITESADVRLDHYYTLAVAIYLGSPIYTSCYIYELQYSLTPVSHSAPPLPLHQTFISLVTIFITAPTWQWSGDIFWHEELLFLVEEPRSVGVQLGDVDQVQLDWIFFPEHWHSHNHFWFSLCVYHHHQGHCTHI